MILQGILVISLLGITSAEQNSTSVGVGTFTFHNLPLPPSSTQPPQTIPSTTPTPGKQIPSKAQYTRTAIHVARSLDPDATETVNVRTRTGDIATLIVKRRSRNGQTTSAPPPLPVTSSAAIRRDAPPGLALSKLADVVTAPSFKSAKVLPPNYAAVPPPVNIRSSLVLVKPQQDGTRARSLLRVGSDGVPEITGVRVPDDEEDRRQTWRNARVINGVLVPNKSGVLSSWVPSPSDEKDPQRTGRVLRYPGTHSYPPALLYSAQSTQTSSRVAFEEGVRTPVSEYAHPELGVQPAGKVAEPSTHSNSPVVSSPAGRDLALASFAQDIHADHSPYVREPAMDELEAASSDLVATTAQPVPPVAVPTSGRRSSLGATVSLTQPMRLAPDSYGMASDQYVMRFPHAMASHSVANIAGHNYAYRPHHYTIDTPVRLVEDNRPFWERLSDSFRDSMASGVAQVSQLARPVMEPLVAGATRLSHQLGFVSNGNPYAEDRLGVQTPAAAALLPALGLVAGGAALGLGAVAVGRYLDVDVMSRRSEQDDDDDDDEMAMEHKRAAATIARMQAEQQMRSAAAAHGEVSQKLRRRRRSSGREPAAYDEAVLAAWDWARAPTSCAQRVFCETVRRRGADDSVSIVEKQAAGFIKMLRRSGEGEAAIAASQLDDVIDAVRRDDCGRFPCSAR